MMAGITERQRLAMAIDDACRAAKEKALRKYDEGRRDWNNHSDTGMDFLFRGLMEETGELEEALLGPQFYNEPADMVNVAAEAVDVINFAAFIRYCAMKRSVTNDE